MTHSDSEAREVDAPRASREETDMHSIREVPRLVNACDEDCAHCDEDCLSRRVEGPAECAWRMALETNDEEVYE